MKTLKLPILTLLIGVISLMSCNKNDDLQDELTVASKQAIVEGKSSLIVRLNNKDWTILNDDIAGFHYEDGYEYLLRVRVLTPPLQSSKTASYELIKQISKEKKTTIFQSNSFSIINNANVEGKDLTPDEITTIKDKIMQYSPFAGYTSLTLDFTYFTIPGNGNRNFIYKAQSITHPEKTGNGNITFKERDEALIQIFTFDFDGKSVSYEYAGSPTSMPYLILDLTSQYKSDYPNLEVAQSGIGMKTML